MYTVIRTYVDQPQLAKELKKHQREIERVISSTPGFLAYYLMASPEGTTSVTVCETRSSCDESSNRASEWLAENLNGFKIRLPEVAMGEVAIQFSKTHAAV